MPVPNWADEQMSNDLPRLRSSGEGQNLEYMEVFPQQARDLAKEIAAFASTNPGTVLLGVSDDGSLVGLADTATPAQRDELLRRVEGLCRGTVKPSITPKVTWAIETDQNVLVIQVPKGTEPVYYSGHIPYVRHLSESRPAEPHEVVERIRSQPASDVESEPNPLQDLMSRLASLLVELLVFAEETKERNVNPWLDQWRSQYEYSATKLREMAADQLAVDNGLSDDFNQLASALEAVASFQHTIGGGPRFDVVKQTALGKILEVKQKYIDSTRLSDNSIAAVSETIKKTYRQLVILAGRMEEKVNQGRIENVQSEASAFGFTLLRLSYYGIDRLRDGLSLELRGIGRDLHLVETERLYMDGGRSINAILDRISAAATRLKALVESLPEG